MYGKALNLILSGVAVPPFLGVPFELREASEADDVALGKAPIVVLRCMFVVSAEGGGGRDERSGIAGSVEARHRNDSPVP